MEVSVDTVGLFDKFVGAHDFKEILDAFNQLCSCLGLDPLDDQGFYHRLKSKLSRNWKAEKLWHLLDKRATQKEYRKQRACLPLKVLIIGGGPCGLRSAIECAFLGAKAVVVEKRDRFSRNNVLHLWPFVIQDLKSLGGKLFYPKFCAGSIDHISIRQLQCILLKVALVLGVEVHDNVSFDHLVPPQIIQETGETVGWRAEFFPRDHYLREFQFQALIGADGKRNTIPCFQRREMRGKLAIGVTANFVNSHSGPEERVQEISGVAFIFNQQFFKDMRQQTLIDLENIVYYKDDTHYFVMCAKKQSLIDKRVIKRDYEDVPSLLSPDNINQNALLDYAKEAADFATEGALKGHLNYAVNHFGEPDVAMFDFTSLYSSLSSCRLEENNGHKLLMAVVGDSLHEPFWPTGSGVARGFLGVLDTAWMLKCLCSGKQTALQVMAERECVYRLLAQTKPANLNKNLQKYTIDPKSRYPSLEYTIMPEQVLHLVVTDKSQFIDFPDPSLVGHTHTMTLNSPASHGPGAGASPAKRRKVSEAESRYIQRQQLIRFVQAAVNYSGLRVTNLTTCFGDGMILAALIGRFRSDLVDWSLVRGKEGAGDGWVREEMFQVVRKEHGLEPPESIENLNGSGDQNEWVPDQDEMFEYISALCDKLKSALLDQIQKLSGGVKTPKPSTPVAAVTPTPPPRAAPLRVKQVMTTDDRSLAEQAAHIAQKRKAAKEFHRSESSPEMGHTPQFARERRRKKSREEEEAMIAELIEEEGGDMEERTLEDLTDEEEVEGWLREWEEEEKTRNTHERHNRRLDDIRTGLLQKRCYMPPDKWKSKPAMIEKLAPDRLREVESLLLSNLSGKVREVERGKKKKPPIKTRKLDKRELEEMETKLEQTGIGSVLFKKDYEKALSRKEELAIAAKTADLKRKAVDGFSADPEGRFGDFDERLKALDKKLKQPNLSGAFKVDDLTKQHKMSALPKKPPVPVPLTSPSEGVVGPYVGPVAAVRKLPSMPLGVPPENQQPSCYLCGGRVYLAEKLCVEGFSMHSRCFRCAYCDTVLRLGAYGFERSDVYGNRFFCRAHLGLSVADKLSRLKKKGALRSPPPQSPQSSENPPSFPTPRPPVGEVKPLQTKTLNPLTPSAIWNGGRWIMSPEKEPSPTAEMKTRPGMIERPPPNVHYPTKKGENGATEEEPEAVLSPRSNARVTLDSFLSPKLNKKNEGGAVVEEEGHKEPKEVLSSPEDAAFGAPKTPVADIEAVQKPESGERKPSQSDWNKELDTGQVLKEEEEQRKTRRPVTPPRLRPPSVEVKEETAPLAETELVELAASPLKGTPERRRGLIPGPLSSALLAPSSPAPKTFGRSELAGSTPYTTASVNTPERAEFVFKSPYPSSDDALSSEETAKERDLGVKAPRKLADREEESGEVSDDEEEEEEESSSEEEEDELDMSDEEWADLEKTLSLKRGSRALTYDEAAALAITWRQRQKTGRESESSGSQDSDDEYSETSDTFAEIAGNSFKDSKTLTPSTSEFEQLTDKTMYYTPSAEALPSSPRASESLSASSTVYETIYETPKLHPTTASGVPRVDSIPFADRSPETPAPQSAKDPVVFRTPMAPPPTRLRPTTSAGLGSSMNSKEHGAPGDRWSTPVGLGPSPLRQAKMEEFQRLKEEARLRAKMKSDDELGIGGPIRAYGSESRLPVGRRGDSQLSRQNSKADKFDPKNRTGSLVEEVLAKSTEALDSPTKTQPEEVFPASPNKEKSPPKLPPLVQTPSESRTTESGESSKSAELSPAKEEEVKTPQRKLSGLMAKIFSPLRKKPPSPTPVKSPTQTESPPESVSDSTSTAKSPAPEKLQSKVGGTPLPSVEIRSPDSPSVDLDSDEVFQEDSTQSGAGPPPSVRALVRTVSIESAKETKLLKKIGRKHTPMRKTSSPGRETTEQQNKSPGVMGLLGLEDKNVTTRRRGPSKATIEEASFIGSEESLDRADGQAPKPVAAERRVLSEAEAEAVSEREVRRIQRAAENLVRQQEHKRANEAQDLQRKLQEVEVRRMEVEQSGNKLERRLRQDPEDRWALEQWLVLVNERNGLEQYENDLNLRKRELELEQEHSRLQNTLRDLMTTGQAEKTREDLQAEQRVLEEMLLVVAQRDALVSQLDRDRERERAAQTDISEAMTKKGFTYRNFSPVFIERVRPYNSRSTELDESDV